MLFRSQTNVQQLPKGKKGDMRRVLKAHHSDALVVSLDFNAQELRVIADYGRDPNLMSCYVGDNLKDMHGLTAAKISQALNEEIPVAIAGNEIQKHYDKPVAGQQIFVRTSNGVLVTVTQPTGNLFVGQRVYIEGSGTEARVVAQ